MPLYTLLNKQTANVSTPPIPVQTSTTGVYQPSTYQAFQATITGTGTVSASVQPVASNDGVNWTNQGSAMSLSGTNTANATAVFNSPFQYWGATLSSISGTGAAVTCILSAS